jgi:hypothetical protein
MKYLKFSLLSCLAIVLSFQLGSAQEITQKSAKASCSKIKEAKAASSVNSSDYKIVEKTAMENESAYSTESSKVASAVAEVEVDSKAAKKSCKLSKAACKKAKNAKVASAVQEKELKQKSCRSKKEKSN